MSDLLVGRFGARFRGARLPCAIGRGGILPAREKREGDGATPAGAWRIEFGYYRADRIAPPRTRIPLVAAGPCDGWSDAADDAAYNAPVALPHAFSHERMRRGDALYDLVLVLDHNRHPARAGAGSAIFLHVWRGPRVPTAGCVAFPLPVLRRIVAAWHPERDRVIVADWTERSALTPASPASQARTGSSTR